MMEDLKGKCALITGAGKEDGIGYAVACKLASCGADLIISDVGGRDSEASLRGIAGQLRAEFGVKAESAVLDVTSSESISQLVSFLNSSRFDSIEILVNNAGVALGVPSEIRHYDEAAWMKTFDINLHGAFRVSRALIPLMEKSGGSIINMASRAGKVPPIWNGAYAASKAGLIMLTKVMALELAALGIRVNAVCPGLIMTQFQSYRLELEADFFNSTIEERKKVLASRVPQDRMGDPGEVAALVAYLASQESSYITGQAINVCGGLTMEL